MPDSISCRPFWSIVGLRRFNIDVSSLYLEPKLSRCGPKSVYTGITYIYMLVAAPLDTQRLKNEQSTLINNRIDFLDVQKTTFRNTLMLFARTKRTVKLASG